MIKLIQNELIKIFKRKSIYILLLLSFIGIIIYNYINPEQNARIYESGTSNMNISVFEKMLDESKNTTEYVYNKSQLDFAKLYNQYETNSWQRYALKEERTNIASSNVRTDMGHDIIESLVILNDYELNHNTLITKKKYEKTKEIYEKYINALIENNWKEYTRLKIENLKEKTNEELISNEEKFGINVEIATYELRLNNDIKYGNDILNQYLDVYRRNYYSFYEHQEIDESNYLREKNIALDKEKLEIAKYAINNKITQDLSQEDYNLLWDNKIDARISLIRTFKHFNLIIIIVAIYISCIIITEEKNKGTLKSLFVKPHTRTEILLSKIFACIVVTIITIIFVIAMQYIIGGVIYGFDSYKLQCIIYNHSDNEIVLMNLLGYLLLLAITKLPMYIMIILFCIFISNINNNTAMNMILILIIFLISSTIIYEWSDFEGIEFITKFFITNNWDFSQFLFGQPSEIKGVNLIFSSIIYLIYAILILLGGINKFKNTDVNSVN